MCCVYLYVFIFLVHVKPVSLFSPDDARRAQRPMLYYIISNDELIFLLQEFDLLQNNSTSEEKGSVNYRNYSEKELCAVTID